MEQFISLKKFYNKIIVFDLYLSIYYQKFKYVVIKLNVLIPHLSGLLWHIFNPRRCVQEIYKVSKQRKKQSFWNTCELLWSVKIKKKTICLRHMFEFSNMCYTNVGHWDVSDTATHLNLAVSLLHRLLELK